jgi:hypothetical protein
MSIEWLTNPVIALPAPLLTTENCCHSTMMIAGIANMTNTC